MLTLLPPIFQGWDDGVGSDTLSRFGAHRLFEMQCLRHIREYAASLIFRQEPLDPPHYLSEDYSAQQAYRNQLYLEHYPTFKIARYDMATRTIQKMFTYPGFDKERVSTFILRIQPSLAQLWCVTNCISDDPRLDVYTLDGVWLYTRPLPGITLDATDEIIDFAFSHVSQQLLLLRADRIRVYAWPELVQVWEMKANYNNFENVLPHPHAPIWFTSRNGNVFMLESWSAQGQCVSSWSFKSHVISSIHPWNSYLLAQTSNTLFVLSLDLRLLTRIRIHDDEEYYYHQLCPVLDRPGCFYGLFMTNTAPLLMFRLTYEL